MKCFEIKAIASILSGLKLNRISDNEVKNALLANYLAVRKVAKGIEEDKMEYVKKFQEDWKEEREIIRKLQAEKKSVDGFDDYFKAVDEANLVLQKMDEAEIEVSIKPVSLDKFVAAVSEEEINYEQVAILVDGGVLEE